MTDTPIADTPIADTPIDSRLTVRVFEIWKKLAADGLPRRSQIDRSQKHCRGHRQRGRDHATHHQRKANFICHACQRERFGQAAGLIKLDIHVLIPGFEAGQIGPGVTALIGTERDLAHEILKDFIIFCP